MTAAVRPASAQSWRGDGLGGLDRGSRVWWRASPEEWLPATIVSISAKECSIALDTATGQGTGKVQLTASVPSQRHALHCGYLAAYYWRVQASTSRRVGKHAVLCAAVQAEYTALVYQDPL